MMEKISLVLILVFSICLLPMGVIGEERCDSLKGYVKPSPDEVHIGPLAIGMPIGKILLVHKDKNYSAVKFTKYWTEKDGQEKYATYEVHSQKDGTGNFLENNVEVIKGRASFLPPRGIFYPLIWQPGKPDVKCGFVSLAWSPWCNVCHVAFFKRGKPAGDYGIELAPTPWGDIKEVNVFDQRLKWYKYDVSRKRRNISISKLLE